MLKKVCRSLSCVTTPIGFEWPFTALTAYSHNAVESANLALTSSEDRVVTPYVGNDGKYYVVGRSINPDNRDRLESGFDFYYHLIDYLKENGYTIFDNNSSC